MKQQLWCKVIAMSLFGLLALSARRRHRNIRSCSTGRLRSSTTRQQRFRNFLFAASFRGCVPRSADSAAWEKL